MANILGDVREGLKNWENAPIEIIQCSFKHILKDIDDREKQDWVTFFKKASQMTEEEVHARVATPAVLEAFEGARLATLPEQVRKRYSEQESEYSCYSIHTQELIDEGIKKWRDCVKAKGREETM